MLWVVPTGGRIEYKESIITVDILVMDLVESDNNNLHEVLNDTYLIMNDIYAMIWQPDILKYYSPPKSVELKPFMERFDDLVAGWSGTFDFRTESLRDRCADVIGAPLTIKGNTIPV